MYIALTCVHMGWGLSCILKLKTNALIPVLVSGLFATAMLTTIWAIFGRINWEFHLVLLILNGVIYVRNKDSIHQLYQSFIREIDELSQPIKAALFIISILIMVQCTTAPFVIDNETYYIQTIKWLNEYGLVKGLANLHISLGQISGWHVLQSAFSFSFLYPNFNDLSGFCLLIGNVFALFKLNEFVKNKRIQDGIIGLFPLANVFFFQFISAPSPDIAVYVLAFMQFYYFIENVHNAEISSFNFIALLSFFILFIKITAFGLILIPLMLLVIHFRKFKTDLLPIGLTGLIVFVLFVTKNALVSGLPFFPLTHFRLPVDFSVPLSSAEFYFNSGKMCMFFVTPEEYQSMSLMQIAMQWLFASKIGALMNISTILVLILSPIFIYKFHHKKVFWLIYGVTIVEFALLLLSSPVYRYFIYLTLFWGFFILICLFQHLKFISTLYVVSVIATAFVLFFPLNFDGLTQNKLFSHNSTFSIKNVVFPHANSKLQTAYKTVQNGNLKYYSPTQNSFFWANGDGDLPCVNKEQINYFEQTLNVVPQMRGKNLDDGFYTQSIQK